MLTMQSPVLATVGMSVHPSVSLSVRKVVSYGRNVLIDATYNLKQSVLKREDSYNDLGVKFDTKLKFDYHIGLNEKINKT